MMTQLISTSLQRNATNLLKTGAALLAANLANQMLRDTAKDTMDSLRMDLRRVRTELEDRRIERLHARGELI